jgi:two-component system phosphate regulon sensor histidine kinase PhoR
LKSPQPYNETAKEIEDLRAQLEETQRQLEEATDIIDAIRSGKVDTLVMKGDKGPYLYTLKGTDHTYRIFIEQMTEGAVTLNKEGSIQYSNSQFASMVYLPLEKVIGQSFFQFIAPHYRDHCRALISSAWKDDLKGEIMLINDHNFEIPVLISLKMLDLDEGLSMSVILTDLTSLKQSQHVLQLKNQELELAQRVAHDLNANLENTVKDRTQELENSIGEKTKVEEDLRSNQERLTRILETMAEGITIVDTNGMITYANPMAQQLLGLKKISEDGQNRYISDWKHLNIDGSSLPLNEHPMTSTMTTGVPLYDHEIAVQPEDNERMYISVNAAPIRNNKGKIVGGVSTFMDVTNRRIAIQQKDEFLSVASHELRTPITSLKAALQLLDELKNNPSSDLLPRLIDQANKSLNRVSILVSDLLDATKIKDGQLHLNKKTFLLSELFADCFQHIRDEDNYKITIEGPDLSVYADPDKIDQVLINFANNAIKYAPSSKHIKVSVDKRGNMVKISLTDYGPGIEAEKIPHLFDRYFRGNNSDQYSGLGLGLYISSEIIKKHGGQIGVYSEVGKGSTFWFTLPLG